MSEPLDPRAPASPEAPPPPGEERPKESLLSKLVLPVLAVAVLVTLVVQSALDAKHKKEAVPQGMMAPAFKLERFQGGTVSLPDLRGRVVMIDFWATWCPPCVEEMPSLLRLAREYEPRGLVFLAVNKDDPETARAAVGVFAAQRVPGLEPYVAFGSDQVSYEYDVQNLPTMFFVGRDGQLVQRYLGYADEQTLRRRIEQALGAGGT